VVKEPVAAYLGCGRLLGGFARISCPRCRGEHVPAFACRTRYFCPSCQAKRAALFAEHLGELRAPVAHRHYVFTIPKALRALFPRGGAFVPVESDARARGPDGRLLVRAGESEVAFSPLELIHALAQQIPDKGQHLVRYDGAYSNRARRLYRAAVGEEGGRGGREDPRDAEPDLATEFRFRDFQGQGMLAPLPLLPRLTREEQMAQLATWVGSTVRKQAGHSA